MPHRFDPVIDLKTNRSISKDAIKRRIHDLADRLQKQLQNQDVTVVPIMTGAFFFAAALVRFLAVKGKSVLSTMMLRPVWAKSYTGTESRKIDFHPFGLERRHVNGRHVLLIDDILDTGQTLHHVQAFFRELGPSQITTVVMLHKPGRQKLEYPVSIDESHICFSIPNYFVVGYGLDFNEMYRELPTVYKLRDDAK